MSIVTIHGEQKEVQQGTTYEAIAAQYQPEYDGTIAVVAVNGKIRELFKRVNGDCTVEFFTLKDDVGHKTYVRTATMLFLKGIHDVFGAEAARKSCVEFTIGRGIYVNTFGEVPVSEKSAERIKERMGQLSEAKAPFMKHSYPIDDAVALFQKMGMDHGKLTGLLDGLLQHCAEFLAGVRQKHSPLILHDDSKPFLLDRLSERPDTLSSFSIK